METKIKYLVRFDDICPTMNWRIWGEIESILLKYDLSPILAVVPDNQDPSLMVEPACSDFWSRVRAWQSRGWAIALHGFQHTYVNKNSGIIGVKPSSEFAGLPRNVQAEKLQQGLQIFASQHVHADCWVAPSHSFDWTTVELLRQNGVAVISDGFWSWPFTDKDGVTWLPQQIWGFCPMPAGIWTVCLHHNRWREKDLEIFCSNIEHYAEHIISYGDALANGRSRRQTCANRLDGFWRYAWQYRTKPILKRLCQKGPSH